MSHRIQRHFLGKRLLGLSLCATLALPLPSVAGTIALATAPLADSTTSSVLPNLMFILDNSGSMYFDFTPDYITDWYSTPLRDKNPWTYASTDVYNYWYSISASEKNCKDSADDDGAINPALSSMDLCVVGDVPYMTSAINSQYYNTAIRYSPGLNFDGTSKASQTNPASVLTDGYNKQNKTQLNASTATIDLTTSYPDRVWCKNPGDTPSGTDCVKNSGYSYPDGIYKYGRDASRNVKGVYGAPYFYKVVPTEYCTSPYLKSCTLSSVPTGLFTFPAYSRWCSDTLLTDCQSVKTTTYMYPRYVGATINAVAATGYLTVDGTSRNKKFTSIKVNGIEILGAEVAWGNTENDGGLAALVATQINAHVSNPEYTAVINGSNAKRIDITSTLAAGATANGAVTYSASPNLALTSAGVSGGVTGTSTPPYTFVRTDIVSTTTSYPKASTRTDCAGATCTYDEEITNFANWYAYYRTRMQAMKSAVSAAFRPIDNRYRVGFLTINSQSTNYLPVDTFNSGAGNQKDLWYAKLFNATPSGGTPLRSTLTKAGRIFAGQKPVGSADPMQYSCQQNFSLLTTDGYWNTDASSDVMSLTGDEVGNMDGSGTARPMYEGPTATTNTLADAAKYYYDTDLRTATLDNCTGALGLDVCNNDVPTSATDNNAQQHMTLFTLGLGVDGTLAFNSDYLSATSGDYYDIKQGTKNWPVPSEGNETTVDDLWHAAVNGRGQYFSAKDPTSLSSGLNTALSSIKSKLGAGAAAATSTLNPVTGDNYAYVASYTTVKWYGNLEGRTIDITTGETSRSAFWCVEDIAADAATGVSACTGKMVSAASSDSRVIKMNKGGALVDFSHDNITSAGLNSYFDSTFLAANLSQWNDLTTAQKTLAAGDNLVKFLRGQNGYEDRSSNVDKLYRYRERVMGDAVESQPAYLGSATFSYTDRGYEAFKTAQGSRAGTVYLGANDGMLHAFNADTGDERWAYVPTMVIPNLWKLADKNYSTMHTYYVNGSPTISDICTANCAATDTEDAVWKTILVAGLNGGGKGYFALDITSPTAPALLWEFTPANDVDVGYSFGQPIVTKKSDGTWVVLVTSGYNNTANDGHGYLYVLDAKTGVKLTGNGKYDTEVGDTTTPSGLARIVAWAEDPTHDNTATYVYGGDLLGNLWRFDINSAPSTGTNPFKVATLTVSTNAQPITTRPELAKIEDKRVVFVATGKYLELSDLTNTQTQSLYAIKDDATTTLTNPRSTLVKQTLTTASASTRTVTANATAVDFTTGRGWFLDFPDSGERNNVDPLLVAGTLIVPSNVPSNTVCSPGGYGWFNYFNYLTGLAISTSDSGLVSQKTNATIVGTNVWRLPNGTYVPSVVTNEDPTPKKQTGVGFSTSGSGAGFSSKRATWRELIE